MKPLGKVGDQVLPPLKLTLKPQPSFRLKSLFPVRMLSGLAGLTAIGVSSWAAVSPPPLLASTTNTAGGRTAAQPRGGAAGAGAGGSVHAVGAAAGPTAAGCKTL